MESYAIMKALQHLRYYLILKEFVLFTNHEALRYVNTKKKLNSRHGKWISILYQYTFILKHKFGKQNKVFYASSGRFLLLTTMENEVVEFEGIKDMYEFDADFENIMQQRKSVVEGASHIIFEEYFLQNGYLFKGNRLCIPNGSMRENILSELHSGGLAGHFGVAKTMILIEEKYYQPKIREM